MEILEVKNLSFKYAAQDTKTLENVNFSVKRGEFVSVCGNTGSGKSTLLSLLKREISPKGELLGEINFKGKSIFELDSRDAASRIGFVSQYPEEQIVTDKVWHEVAFGLENLGVDQKTMQRRVAETFQYFGIGDMFDKRVSELSGGQKQMLALASVMAMDPEILILDEPTSQLDPISASDFISTLKKLCRERLLTVIIAEHRLEEIIPKSDKLLVINNGTSCFFGKSEDIAKNLEYDSDFYEFLPAPARLYARLGADDGPCPFDVRSGRDFVESFCENTVKRLDINEKPRAKKSAIKAKELCFRYEKDLPDVLDRLSLDIREGELFVLLGGNGSGKTTALGAVSGINKCYSGKLEILGKEIKKYKFDSLYDGYVAMLPQDANALFTRDSVREEINAAGLSEDRLPVELRDSLDKHPYDLSGGQRQLLALCMILARDPKILLLDEPTKGLDALAKRRLTQLLKGLCENNITVVAVTHDVEFAAESADRIALFFRGRVVSEDDPNTFFSENNFYTTAISRMTRGYFDNAVSVDDAEKLCRMNERKR